MTCDDHCWSQVSLGKEESLVFIISGDEEPILSPPPNMHHLSLSLCGPDRGEGEQCLSDMISMSIRSQANICHRGE